MAITKFTVVKFLIIIRIFNFMTQIVLQKKFSVLVAAVIIFRIKIGGSDGQKTSTGLRGLIMVLL